jgi:peptide/nickel transport system ATP-binding protein
MTVVTTRTTAAGPDRTDAAEQHDPNAALLAVENLRIWFGDTEVVKGISFQAHPGRCLAIVGESGSGKSVTARTLARARGSRPTGSSSAAATGRGT